MRKKWIKKISKKKIYIYISNKTIWEKDSPKEVTRGFELMSEVHSSKLMSELMSDPEEKINKTIWEKKPKIKIIFFYCHIKIFLHRTNDINSLYNLKSLFKTFLTKQAWINWKVCKANTF